MYPCKKYLVLVFCAFYCTGIIRAQYDEKNFTRYAVKDGLADNNITCLQQDNEGYMWIGTAAGLNRFDGNTFKKFFQSTPPINLPSSNIGNLKQFGPHQLGIITKAGFQLLNTIHYSVQNFRINDSSSFTTQLNAVWDAVELPGKSYAVTTAAGFYVFNKNGNIVVRHDAYNVNDIGKKRILYGRNFFKISDSQYLVYIEEARTALYDDHKRTYTELDNTNTNWNFFKTSGPDPMDHWTLKHQLNAKEYIFIPGYRNAIFHYDHSTKKIISSSVNPDILHNVNWESKIVALNDSVLVVNDGLSGFYFLNFNSRTKHIYCDGKKYLPGYKISCLFVDKEKRLWVGTTRGLLKQELYPPFITTYHYPADPKKITGGFTCAYRYKKKLYAGRFSGNNGLAIIDVSTMKLIREIDFFGKQGPWNEIHSIEMYYPDTLWIGTNAGLLWYDTKTDRYGKVWDEKKYPWAFELSIMLAPARSDGYAWMCGILGGKVIRYHIPSRTFTLFTSRTKPALPFDHVKRITYDSYGDVWISGHSLARWNNQKQNFDTLLTVYGGANKFNDDIITISADANGSLWMHNDHNGLLEYKIKEKKFVAYSMKDGLPSDVLQSLSPVADQKLWIASNNQICLFDTKDKKFTIYDEGLPEQRPTGKMIYFDSAMRQLYLCSNEYLVKFPFVPAKKRDNSSNLIIEELTVDNNKTYYQPPDDIHIKYNQNNLSINFSVIDFEKSNYQFAYRLNKEGNWTVIGNQRNIILSNLSPGSYALELRASGKPGIEKIKKLSFAISPPYWKSYWFAGLITALLTVSIYILYRTRIRYIRQRADIDRQLSQTEMKALQAQMNPHFIFNSLNSIREMILNNENKDASHYLSKFAHLIRITLDQSSQSLVSLRNTIDYLERYMEMESIRNNLFTYRIAVDEKLDLDETVVPPMLIQPFIENAIWHGISACNKDIHVNIHFNKDHEKLVCIIDDSGIGINQSQKNKPKNTNRHKPVGIENIRNRMKLLNEKYDLSGHFEIIDKKDIPGNTECGTRVILQLPLEIKES